MRLRHWIAGCTLFLLAWGCSKGSSGEKFDGTNTGGRDSGGLGTGGNGTGGVGDGGNPNASTGGTFADLTPPDCPPTAQLGVRIFGRHDGCTEGAIRQAWSGTGFIARFEGTGLSFVQSGSSIQYTVLVDGELKPNLVTQSGQHAYVVATGLPTGEHTVEIYRRGEASFGVTTLLSVEVEGGQLLDPPSRSERSIEVFGDSITCGYGNEGELASCPFSADTENHYLTYAAIMARSFDAELSTVAWSGKGVVINYGGDMSTTLPQMAERAVPSSSTSVWDFSVAPEPDLVIINLGTNDFSTENDPSDADFVSGYGALLRTIRSRYPKAFILCTVGPLLSGSDLAKARSGIEAAVNQRKDEGDQAIMAYAMQTGNPSPGCDWHPSLATHEAMADELGSVIADELGW
jgi:lysophospholipase L1-like esterase